MTKPIPVKLSAADLAAIYESAHQTERKESYVENTWQQQIVLDAEKYDALRGHIAYLEKHFDSENPEAINNLTVHILRNFSRERIVNLAMHLLGSDWRAQQEARDKALVEAAYKLGQNSVLAAEDELGYDTWEKKDLQDSDVVAIIKSVDEGGGWE